MTDAQTREQEQLPEHSPIQAEMVRKQDFSFWIIFNNWDGESSAGQVPLSPSPFYCVLNI